MARGLSGVGLVRIMKQLAIPFRNNFPPGANAGSDQSVGEGTVVALDGRGSTDPELDPLGFSWTQVGGPAVMLAIRRVRRRRSRRRGSPPEA